MDNTTRILNALFEAAGDSDEDVAIAAIEALANYKSAAAVDFLVELLSGKNLKQRDVAKGILIQKRHAAVVPLLLQDLKSPRGYVRLQAAELLAGFSDRASVGELVKCLNDEHATIRLHAATALGNIGATETFDALLAALMTETDKDVGAALSVAIGRVGDMGHVQKMLEVIVQRQAEGNYRGSLKSSLESAVTELLTKLGDVDGVLAALKHENAVIRTIAARVLGRIAE